MTCCVLLAGAIAAFLALSRRIKGGVSADPKAWRLPTEKPDA
jgi:hypothetical protein